MDLVAREDDAAECEARGRLRRAAEGRVSPLGPRGDRRSNGDRQLEGSSRAAETEIEAAAQQVPAASRARNAIRSHPARSWSARSRGSTTPVSRWSGIPSIPRAASCSPGRPCRSCPNRSIGRSSSPSSRGDLGKPIVLGVLVGPKARSQPSHGCAADRRPADRPGNPGRRATGVDRRE